MRGFPVAFVYYKLSMNYERVISAVKSNNLKREYLLTSKKGQSFYVFFFWKIDVLKNTRDVSQPNNNLFKSIPGI
jgi:hypothetical protein